MFDRLIDFIIELKDQLLFWAVVDHYDMGVRLRFGKNKGVLEPGLHWKIPFADKILTHMIKTTTVNLSEQSVTTKDWKQVVVRAIIKYEVSNVEVLLLEVNDPIDALSDMTKGIIRTAIITRDWYECNGPDLSREITGKVKNEAKKWGVRVDTVTLTDLGEIPSFRLFNSALDANVKLVTSLG
jgi:regulator of protease activity HflC (stomatin/prohibitin superfamily)